MTTSEVPGRGGDHPTGGRDATITNGKLRSISPTVWTSYPGLSLIYDPPASGAIGGLQPLEGVSRAAAAEEEDLYGPLSRLATQIQVDVRDLGTELCLLPRHTYHVTLVDGVNRGSRAQVRGDLRAAIDRTLGGLPDSLLWADPVMRTHRDEDLLWSVWSQPVTYAVDSLEVRGYALVAALRPADGASAAARDEHAIGRGLVASRLEERFGIGSTAWRPHVTLGYAPDHTAAERVREIVVHRQDDVRASTEGRSNTFRSASVYGFTDMVSFWRLGQ
jgi:hypothetical protein